MSEPSEWATEQAKTAFPSYAVGGAESHLRDIARALDTAHAAGFAAGVGAGASECDRIAAQHPADGGDHDLSYIHDPEQRRATLVQVKVAQIIANAGCVACAASIRALLPTGGTK